jgi:hypothetical protein
MIFKVMALAMITAGCVTPDRWSAESHREMLLQCRVACIGSGVASYESYLGQCKCHKLPVNLDE